MAAGVCLIHGLRGRALPFTLRCDASCASFRRCLLSGWASLMAQMVKNPSTMQETWDQFPGWEDSLEKGMATHSSILAWRIPMDRGAWQATVHGVAKSQTRLSN